MKRTLRNLVFCAVALGCLSFGKTGSAEEFSSARHSTRCYCEPQGSYYVLWYIDRDGLRHVIYTYDDYGDCLQGLNNTALCH